MNIINILIIVISTKRRKRPDRGEEQHRCCGSETYSASTVISAVGSLRQWVHYINPRRCMVGVVLARAGLRFGAKDGCGAKLS